MMDGRVWTVAEIEREYGNAVEAADAVSHLRRTGLIHRFDGEFVVASRTAIAVGEIWGNTF
jgi:hypothetical protein